MMHLKRHVIILVLTFILTFGGVIFFFSIRPYFRRYRMPESINKLRSTLELIDKYYVDSVSIDSIVLSVIPHVMRQLDPHSSYLSIEERNAEKEVTTDHFFGIGITFNTFKDTAVIVSVIPQGPSDLAGLKAGSRIIAVDDIPITGKIPNDSIMGLLRGPNNSLVNLTTYNPYTGEVSQTSVVRGEVAVRQVDASFMVNDSLGCIRLPRFGISTHNHFMRAYAQLKQQGMKGLILDLRGNPGGIMQSAILLSNEFLPSGNLIIYTEGKAVPRSDIYSDGSGNLQQIPTYILINEESASASEIVSGALQDNDRAIVIGRRSFGKGLVQRVIEHEDGSAIHLTIARYYTASGRCVQKEYKLGDNISYHSELYNRYMQKEMYHKDSIRPLPSDIHKTKSGRIVYGGGGIIPDVFIPRDTTGFTSYLGEVMSKGLIQKFAFEYSDRHRLLLSDFGDYLACYKFLQNQGIVWQFAQYAHTRGVRMKNYLIYLSHDIIARHLYTLIIGTIYGEDASAKVSSYKDDMIQEAARLFSNQVYSPLDLKDEDKLILEPLSESPRELNRDRIDNSTTGDSIRGL